MIRRIRPFAVTLVAAGFAAAVGAGGIIRASQSPAIETLRLRAGGEPVRMKTKLGLGELYLLKAAGSVEVGGRKLDAEYAFGGGAPVDELQGVDVGVDIGVLQRHPAVHTRPTPPGPGRARWFGDFREDHVYYQTVTGTGDPLTVRLVQPAGSGSGSIALSLIPLSPAPPKIGQPIEAVAVPITKTVVRTGLTTQPGKLYLLQASGAGAVGGGGTHEGDAEYMDWDVTGEGKNEGEAGADFGIGVDELIVPKMSGSRYQQRQRWWGPWRMDHTYYMLFLGTGRPIHFLYWDSGYGDNSTTARLAVKLFDLP